MRIKKTTMLETKIVEFVSCNKCESVMFDLSKSDNPIKEGIHVDHTFGYFSNVIGDMTSIHFDLCETCVKDLVDSFKNKKDVIDESFWSVGGVIDDSP